MSELPSYWTTPCCGAIASLVIYGSGLGRADLCPTCKARHKGPTPTVMAKRLDDLENVLAFASGMTRISKEKLIEGARNGFRFERVSPTSCATGAEKQQESK